MTCTNDDEVAVVAAKQKNIQRRWEKGLIVSLFCSQVPFSSLLETKQLSKTYTERRRNAIRPEKQSFFSRANFFRSINHHRPHLDKRGRDTSLFFSSYNDKRFNNSNLYTFSFRLDYFIGFLHSMLPWLINDWNRWEKEVNMFSWHLLTTHRIISAL